MKVEKMASGLSAVRTPQSWTHRITREPQVTYRSEPVDRDCPPDSLFRGHRMYSLCPCA